MKTPVTFYSRANCPLCEDAKEAIRASGAEVEITEVDVDRDPELKKLYSDDVPVVHIDGAEGFRHRVDPKLFAAYVKGGLKGWRVVEEHHLEKQYDFPDFAQGLAFVNRVGALAEEQNHHPDVVLQWGKVTLTLRSHDVEAITGRDFRLAAAVDGLS
jgi:4a-hydroxytetrahydrobiopterin dehydratase